jgi:hypothetical protein
MSLGLTIGMSFIYAPVSLFHLLHKGDTIVFPAGGLLFARTG